MDQLKVFLRQLVKHRFWVISGIVTLTGNIVWYLAATDLDEQYKKRESALNTSFTTANKVKSTPNHPNQHSEAQMRVVTTETTNAAYDAWATQYDRQQEVLVWPARLTPEFEQAVKKLRPIESVELDTPIGKAIPATLREIYRNYINDELPKLAEIIKARWTGKSERNAPVTPLIPNGRPTEDDKYLVAWSPENQTKIVGRFEWPNEKNGIPNTVQILYAQEDFWVLEAVMNVIATTNGDVDARYKAAIKQIEAIELGADVGATAGQVIRLDSDGQNAQQTSTQPGAAVVGADPAEGRYVDNDLKPVPAAKLRDALKELKKETSFLTAAKRMPVRMRLTIDIRKLNQLLANCGNSKLPIEIRQVRVNRNVMAPTTSGSLLPSSRPGIDGAPGARGPADIYTSTVELYGIIYIYNPPLESLRGGGEGARA